MPSQAARPAHYPFHRVTPARRSQFGAGRSKVDTSTSMAISYHIEEADLSASAAAIQGLWVANLVGHDPRSAAAKLRLGYVENPAGPRHARSCCTRTATHSPRACRDCTRASSTSALVVCAPSGWPTMRSTPAHRSLGPALMLMRRGAQLGAERFDLTYGLPNRKAAAVLARAGLKRLGMVRRYAKPLCSRAQLAQHLPPWLAALCAPLVDAAAAPARRWRVGRPRSRASSAAMHAGTTRRSTSSGRVAPTSLLLSERTGAMLRWRFGTAGSRRLAGCAWRATCAGVARGYVGLATARRLRRDRRLLQQRP